MEIRFGQGQPLLCQPRQRLGRVNKVRPEHLVGTHGVASGDQQSCPGRGDERAAGHHSVHSGIYCDRLAELPASPVENGRSHSRDTGLSEQWWRFRLDTLRQVLISSQLDGACWLTAYRRQQREAGARLVRYPRSDLIRTLSRCHEGPVRRVQLAIGQLRHAAG